MVISINPWTRIMGPAVTICTLDPTFSSGAYEECLRANKTFHIVLYFTRLFPLVILTFFFSFYSNCFFYLKFFAVFWVFSSPIHNFSSPVLPVFRLSSRCSLYEVTVGITDWTGHFDVRCFYDILDLKAGIFARIWLICIVDTFTVEGSWVYRAYWKLTLLEKGCWRSRSNIFAI